MNVADLITRFSDTTEKQRKAIFSTLFIAGNRLQTLFDNHIPELSLKQFMLFVLIRQSPQDSRALCICPTKKADSYFQNEFSQYQDELRYLFEVYTVEEIETLYTLLSKLYAGIENLEAKAVRDAAEKSE